MWQDYKHSLQTFNSMPITIFHGEHHIKSRQALQTLRATLSSQNIPVQSLEVKTLELTVLENLLGTTSLFAEKTAIVLEELHSLPKSERKNLLLKLVGAHSSELIHVILWEKKKLTATELKLFDSAKIQIFPLSSSMFAWINSLDRSPVTQQVKLLQSALQSDGAEFCFAMFARQVRIWLGKTNEGSPKQIQLLDLHQKLMLTDYQVKTGQSNKSLGQILVELVLELS